MFPPPLLCRLQHTGAALLCLVLTGCSLSGQGNFRTQDGQPLRLADDVLLRPGPMLVQFEPDPWLFGRLRLYAPGATFSARVPAGHYVGPSFALYAAHGGSAYDIQARWHEVRGEKVDREREETCTTAGFCNMTVRVLDCGRRRYLEGSRGYRRHADDDDCEVESVVVWDYFPDCPGSRVVRERYQVYKLQVSLDFKAPFADRPPVAEFDGETGNQQRLVETLDRGQCRAD